MPVGIVDLDNTSTTRALVRKLDAFQTTRVVRHYANMNQARQAMQHNEVYAVLYFPEHTTDDLLSSRQPKISFYYNNAYYTAGALLYRDLKTISTLGSAAVGQATMRAKGFTDKQIATFLQPIRIDLHPLNNPEINYNVYLTTMLAPGCLFLFIFLITAYSIGTELKFDRSKEWMQMADGNVHVAMIGKLLPQFLIFLLIAIFYIYYVYIHLHFPHEGGIGVILFTMILSLLASQAFGTFIFGLMPSLRMSMSICSLWGALSFSAVGTTFPISAMNPMIESLVQLFPLRHYFMIYQISVFNGYPLSYAWINILALLIFIMLPLFVMRNIKKTMLEYVYIP